MGSLFIKFDIIKVKECCLMTTILIDADACPVVKETIRIAGTFGFRCILICDTTHEMHRDGAETIIVSKGADAVDFVLVNRVQKDDIVVTQDYGLAAMVLAKKAILSIKTDDFIRRRTLTSCCMPVILLRKFEWPAVDYAGPKSVLKKVI